MALEIEKTPATAAVKDVADVVADAVATTQKAAVEITKTVADTASKTVAAPAPKAVAAPASKPVADAAPKIVAAPAAKAAKPSRTPKTARRLRADKPAAKKLTRAAAAKPTKTRAAKPARRAKTINQPRAASAAALIERTSKMTTEATNWFANFSNAPGSERFQSLFANAGERSQEAVRRSTAVAGELADIAKANVEALVSAGRIAASGAQSLGQDVVARSRESVEQASEAVKSLAEAKSPTEFFQLQSELVKASFDRLVSEGSRLTESMVKLAGEAIQPLSNRASLNAERINASLSA